MCMFNNKFRTENGPFSGQKLRNLIPKKKDLFSKSLYAHKENFLCLLYKFGWYLVVFIQQKHTKGIKRVIILSLQFQA